MDADGKVVGRHDGAIFYTIGQRHGLGVGGGLPYYVVGKDMAKNEVYVSRDINSESLWVTTLRLDHTHWIGEQSPAEGAAVMVRLRHRGPLLAAHAYDAGARIELVDSERSSPAGQSVVLYDDGVCLGGGIVSL